MIDASSTSEEILDAVRKTFEELFEIPPADLHLGSELYKELDLDSLDAADMRASLQEVASARIPEAKFQDVRTVNDVVQLLQSIVRG